MRSRLKRFQLLIFIACFGGVGFSEMSALGANGVVLDLSSPGYRDADKLAPRSAFLEAGWIPVSDFHLRGLPADLDSIYLFGTSVTDRGMKFLPRSLRGLDLGNTRITVRGLKKLPRGLQMLDLSQTQVKDCDLRFLPPRLQSLQLAWTEITNEGLAYVPASVQFLDLTGTRVTPEGIAHFKEARLRARYSTPLEVATGEPADSLDRSL